MIRAALWATYTEAYRIDIVRFQGSVPFLGRFRAVTRGTGVAATHNGTGRRNRHAALA